MPAVCVVCERSRGVESILVAAAECGRASTAAAAAAAVAAAAEVSHHSMRPRLAHIALDTLDFGSVIPSAAFRTSILTLRQATANAYGEYMLYVAAESVSRYDGIEENEGHGLSSFQRTMTRMTRELSKEITEKLRHQSSVPLRRSPIPFFFQAFGP